MKGKKGQARGHKTSKTLAIPIIPGSALLLTRMSSMDQEENGYGSEGQRVSGEEYVKRHGLRLVKPPYQLVESAFDEDNRAKFDEFMATAEELGVEHLLFGRVDRSLRNLFDLYRLEKAARNGRVLHYFQEGFTYSKNSSAGDFWRFSVQGVAAMGESRGISERTKRILKGRARDGYWPQKAPFGYMNVGKRREKRVEPNPDEARWYIRIKELAATGQYSLVRIVDKLKSEGCTLRLVPNLIERVIRSPFGAGRFQWDGEWITENVKHKPLITWALHLSAVAGLERLNKPKFQVHDWPYAGLIQCSLCSRAIVFETKKKKLKAGGENFHVYAHCAGIRSAPERTCAKCENIYLKGAELEQALGEVIRPISMSREVVDRIVQKIAAGADEETLAKETEMATLKREIAKLGTYVERCYMDKMENRISEDFWREQTKRWQEQRIVLQEKARSLEASGPDSYLAIVRRVLEPTISLEDKYFSLSEHKRATLLRIVCSNLKQDQKKIVPTYRTPYGFLVSGNDSGNWLRD